LCDSNHSNASSINPPSQPASPLLCSQSTNSCSDNDNNVPVLIAHLDSIDPTVENAQHDPHCAWYFTGFTTFLSLQSNESGRLTKNWGWGYTFNLSLGL